MLISSVSSSTLIHPLFKANPISKVARVALPIIVVAGLTAGMIACSVFAPIPFLVILGAAGTLSVSHTFAVRNSPEKYLKFLNEECQRLRKGELPSVTAEEMHRMVRSMKFQSVLSKIVLAINAIFLMAPLSMRDFNDYTRFDRLIPFIEFYAKLIEEPLNITQQFEQEEIKKEFSNKSDQEIDDLCKVEGKFRKEKANYQKYTRAMFLLALDKLLALDNRAFYPFVDRKPEMFPMLSRIAVMEELESELYLKKSNCPPTLEHRRQDLLNLQDMYRKTALRGDKEQLMAWFIEDKPQIKDDHPLKPLYEAISEYADDIYAKDESVIYKASKNTQIFLQNLQKHLPKDMEDVLKIDVEARKKIKTNDTDIFTPIYRLSVLQELETGMPLDDKAFQDEFLKVQKEYQLLKPSQIEDLKKSLVLGEKKGGAFFELYKKISYLAQKISAFQVCDEKLLRRALAKKGVKQYFKYMSYCLKKNISQAAASVFYIFP